MRALRVFSEALALARSGGTARLELETALLRFVLAAEDPTLDALGARVAALEEGRGGNAAVSAAPASALPAPKAAPKAARKIEPEPEPEPEPVAEPVRAPQTLAPGEEI